MDPFLASSREDFEILSIFSTIFYAVFDWILLRRGFTVVF
jgi:hypothetical protein